MKIIPQWNSMEWIRCLCHKLKFSNPCILGTRWLKPEISQTWIISSNRIQSLKYPKSTTSDCKDLGLKSHSLWQRLIPFKSCYNQSLDQADEMR